MSPLCFPPLVNSMWKAGGSPCWGGWRGLFEGVTGRRLPWCNVGVRGNHTSPSIPTSEFVTVPQGKHNIPSSSSCQRCWRGCDKPRDSLGPALSLSLGFHLAHTFIPLVHSLLTMLLCPSHLFGATAFPRCVSDQPCLTKGGLGWFGCPDLQPGGRKARRGDSEVRTGPGGSGRESLGWNPVCKTAQGPKLCGTAGPPHPPAVPRHPRTCPSLESGLGGGGRLLV